MDTKEVLINKRPALILALAVLVTVLLSLLSIIVNEKLYLIILLVAFLVGTTFIILFLKAKSINGVIIISISLILSLIIGVKSVVVVNDYNKAILNGNVSIVGTVCDISNKFYYEDECYRQVTVKTNINNKKIKVRFNVDGNCDVYLGNYIYAKGDIYKYDIYNNGKLNVGYLTDKVYYGANVYDYSINSNIINGNVNKLKFKILNGLKIVMPSYYGVAYAMLFGETAYMYGELLEDFRSMGIAHVFAVSGLHISFLFLFISFLFKVLKIKSVVSFILTSIILFLYVGVCGFSSSCIRAFVIVLVVGLARLFYLKPDRLSCYLIAFILAVIANPFDFYSVGFKLSFIVYFAIVFFNKPCEKLLSKIFFNKLASIISPCIVAYIASLPLLIDNFGSVSLFSMLFNMVFVPILGFNYILVFILALAICILPFYVIFSYIPNIIFAITSYAISLLNVNMFMLNNIAFKGSIFPYYILFIGNSGFLNLTKRYKLIFNVITITAFVLLFIYINFYI